ncbi:MAG: LamB/YcsF family protein [Chloroflexi bacterium]|nr:LamB/YcsF family protein [Chloroflexota bacterium]MBT3863251.1 LamB/YcsF family protein [Chloroflexota bacterium]MBT4141600.1 LamB/YcsF family protein [Chloroflexota bacterium]MBT4944297.1 LamB/YcsF family protein [Chloroflexota bacterium]MBT5253165.1 LamB/YcsF family protein [Chloroflexota bacterium]
MTNSPTGKIDFNADIGESFAGYVLGLDSEIIKYITSANIATGFHAGDPDWMAKTVNLAIENGVGVGAHPAYPDLAGFGRRNMDLTPVEVRNAVTYQVGALAAFTPGRKLQHVKPHGALYNTAVRDQAVAEAVVLAVKAFDPELIHVVLAGSQWESIARAQGVRVARECYADRAVTAEGTLVPRSQPGAVVHDHDQVVERSLKLATEGKVIAIDGTEIDFSADSICLHGDTAGAVELAAAVRSSLEAAGVEITSMNKLVTGFGAAK